MDGASILLVVAALGVSFGWQPDKDDPRAYEVTAQIEPELLDVLKSGKSVPIEAHVPAEVAPIRKVRIVVGNGTLPRQSLTAAAQPSERIVRGQEPTPQTHTARYEEIDPWASDRYSTNAATAPPDARQFDQRGATIGVDNIRMAQAPSPWDRAQTTTTDTVNGLRDGVESGIQQANDQFSRAGNQLSTSATNAGNAVNQQYQNLTGTAAPSQPSSWPAAPPLSSAPTSVSAPPALSAAPTLSAPANRSASPTTWSSIRPELAPPRLMNPPMTTLGSSNASNRFASAPGGPSFPTADTRTPLHSVLSAPAATTNAQLPPPPTTSSTPNWASEWGSARTATAANATNRPTQLAVRDPAEEARWAWPAPSTSAAAPVASAPATNDRYTPAAATTTPANDIWADFPPAQPAATPVASSVPPDRYPTQPANQPIAAQPVIGTASTATVPPGLQPAGPTDQLPWIPLLAVSVSLAGSLGANLFLGWSYADARNRYRNLVRKTTNSFHRATGAAA